MPSTPPDPPVPSSDDPLTPLNTKEKPKRATAVALEHQKKPGSLPTVTAAGRGLIAEQILQIAFERGIPVREDAVLAEMLAALELDSPIPSEAFMPVAEILYYVYQANRAPDPFGAVFKDWDDGDRLDIQSTDDDLTP